MSGTWEFWIDRGGTFTDVIARLPDGALRAMKLLSESPDYPDAASEGVRRMMGVTASNPLPSANINAVKMGTTVATNALLERKGERTCFVVNEGLEDLLVIGDQTRPDIFAMAIERPEPLHGTVIGIAGRVSPDGEELAPLNEADITKALMAAKASGCSTCAIALMHAYANPAHELRVAKLAEEAGFDTVICSHVASPLIKIVPRASTAVLDAYLTPVLKDYAGRVAGRLDGAPLYFMQSSGGLTAADQFAARHAVLSGPAGGVAGMAKTAKAAGYPRVIGFDMGGTSTDVSRFDGDQYAKVGEAVIAGQKLRAPMLAVHTVAAGGGSVLFFDGERARVGPDSAGAMPGPAGYGRGGPAAVTDANIVLGRIQPDWFPKTFGEDGQSPLDPEASRTKLGELAEAMELPSAEAAAEGFLAVAIENMAQAIKQISIGEGVDPARYALASFGGAGAQHACKVADAIGMKTVLIHPFAGLLSALGIGLADLRIMREKAIEARLSEGFDGLPPLFDDLSKSAETALAAQGVSTSKIRLANEIRLRVAGSDTTIALARQDINALRQEFDSRHERLFGFRPDENAELIIESISVEAEATPEGAEHWHIPTHHAKKPLEPVDMTRVFEDGNWQDWPVYELEILESSHELSGPLLFVEPHSTIVVERGWSARKLDDGMLVLEREGEANKEVLSTDLDPVRLELFNKRFMSVAEQMGVALERTAHSVNMKERLDFSCAVFDADGGLVANAPHMPVHLGSMSASVRSAVAAHPDLGPGDAVAVNAPYDGGTHLPDITVVVPVHDESGEHLFYVAARGHHADVGGIAPGSMPPFSTSIEEEGVSFDNALIMRGGRFLTKTVDGILSSGRYPARNPAQNIADLKAQLAACARGSAELKRMVTDHGLDVVRAYMGHVQDNAERAVRRVIDALEDGDGSIRIDDGAEIRVAVRVDRRTRSAVVDFTGTSAQLGSNFNAPSSVGRAAVLYVFRCLVGDQIPLNEGCLKPIELVIPEGCLLNPKPPAAVVAGNVETSQMVVDALFAATGRMAAAQGTMNNLTFGNARHQYYETICGGSGAGIGPDGAAFEGTDAIHTHMTNSRMTDPEVLERRYPVRLLAHRIRGGSGGDGAFRGGDGSVRRLQFLEEMDVALLSSHRKEPPKGLAGGGDGMVGAQRVIRADGRIEPLEGLFSIGVQPGDCIEIETPGGGAYLERAK